MRDWQIVVAMPSRICQSRAGGIPEEAFTLLRPMSVTNAALAKTTAVTPEATLREVVEALAPISKLAGSDGEREAADWLTERLTAAGARDARVEEAPFHGDFSAVMAMLAAAATASGVVGLTRLGRPLGALGAAASAALMADDASNGFRPFRKAVIPEQMTSNVIAELGDSDAQRTLVLLAHHDTARTGQVFDPTLQRELAERFPGIIERIDTSLPQWWAAASGPVLAALGAASGRRKLTATGVALSAAATALFADIQRSDVVPGANDNLSACAVLVAIAEAVRDRPIKGLRILIVSCGAEEVLQGGIHDFAERHLKPLDRDQSWVLTLDTVGSPGLVLLEGEGPFVMEDYFDIGWRDLIWRVSQREEIPIRRGMRARASTDAVIPSRMGIPTACIVSADRHKALSNYHLPSDAPENLHYPAVACCVDLVEAVAQELADTV